MYSAETLEVLNQPVETVKVKRVLSDEQKEKMAQGRKKKALAKQTAVLMKDVLEESVDEEVVMEGISPPVEVIASQVEVEAEVDAAVDEIVAKNDVDEPTPKWFLKYLDDKTKHRKRKQAAAAASATVAKKPSVGKIIVPEVKIEEKPAMVTHLMKSIFPNRYK